MRTSTAAVVGMVFGTFYVASSVVLAQSTPVSDPMPGTELFMPRNNETGDLASELRIAFNVHPNLFLDGRAGDKCYIAWMQKVRVIGYDLAGDRVLLETMHTMRKDLCRAGVLFFVSMKTLRYIADYNQKEGFLTKDQRAAKRILERYKTARK